MNSKILPLLIILFCSSLKGYCQDPNFHVYIMFGQSNMEGMGPIESQDRATNNRVKVIQDQTCSNLNRNYGQWYTAAPPLNRCWSKLGPGDYFGKTLAEAKPSNVTIGLVPASVSGCDIAFFQKSAPLGKASTKGGGDAGIGFNGGYAWMIDLAKKAQKVGVIKGIIFHQGETNTNDPNWKYKVQEIVKDLKKDLGLGDIPFLAGELLYKQYGSCCSSHNTEVNKLPGLIPNCYVISASGLAGQDVAHFTSASYREFGKRYAQKMLSVEGNGECSPTPVTPSVKINNDEWQPITTINASAGSKFILGPQPTSGGSWSWTGCGTSGTAREQSLSATGPCKAIATYTNECGKKSDITFNVITSGVTSIFDGTGNSNVVVFPKPCKERLSIEINNIYSNSLASASIYNVEGVLVFRGDINFQNLVEINTSNLTPGIYFLKIVNSEFTASQKIVKVE